MAKFTIVKYVKATHLDADEYDIFMQPTPYLDQILASHGECDNDTILEIDGAKVCILYKWSEAHSAWQMIQ